jgi:hypothetical protein
MRTILGLCCITLLSPSASSAADWPQWLGPERNGVSAETGLVKQWPESGPKTLWRTELGKGFSAISVADGRLYTMYADAQGEFIVCLNASTGAELWRVRTGNL